MAIETQLIDRTLQLSPGDRAELARQLILSLESAGPEAEIDPISEAEIERRLDAFDRGEVQAVEWRDAVERARASLRKSGDR